MKDPTEAIRRRLAQHINENPLSRRALEDKYGIVWNTEELKDFFEVITFAAPFVVVKRKSDGQVGSLEFQHFPRFYYNFVVDVPPKENDT